MSRNSLLDLFYLFSRNARMKITNFWTNIWLSKNKRVDVGGTSGLFWNFSSDRKLDPSSSLAIRNFKAPIGPCLIRRVIQIAFPSFEHLIICVSDSEMIKNCCSFPLSNVQTLEYVLESRDFIDFHWYLRLNHIWLTSIWIIYGFGLLSGFILITRSGNGYGNIPEHAYLRY